MNRSKSENINIKQTKLSGYLLNPSTPTFNNNWFDTLGHDEKTETTEKQNSPKAPHLFVAVVENIQPLRDPLIAITRNKFQLNILVGYQVKSQSRSTQNIYPKWFSEVKDCAILCRF